MKNRESMLTCDGCPGQCCRHVATQIDEPDCKRDYDHIRWYLLHKNMFVFIDDDGDWYLEFVTDCEQLDDSYRCMIYEKRPRICRQYGEQQHEVCEYLSDEKPYVYRFSSAAEFEAYLAQQGVDWRWKKKKAKKR